jgi:hypothetical protein
MKTTAISANDPDNNQMRRFRAEIGDELVILVSLWGGLPHDEGVFPDRRAFGICRAGELALTSVAALLARVHHLADDKNT